MCLYPSPATTFAMPSKVEWAVFKRSANGARRVVAFVIASRSRSIPITVK